MSNPPDNVMPLAESLANLPSAAAATLGLTYTEQDPATATVEYIKPELLPFLPDYAKIRDVVAGSGAIKAKLDVYLPRPNAHDIFPG
jgi:hypothetical protein